MTLSEKASKMSMGAKFKEQLNELITTLRATYPWYVRCVKPNSVKRPGVWEGDLVLAQLRYAGMLETIRIRKTGYPVRMEFAAFVARFRGLAPHPPAAETPDAHKAFIAELIPLFEDDAAQWQCGHNKVFMRDTTLGKLEEQRRAAVRK
eukprot:CAMPEP_0198345958 /NCGR_PEP_ID=MMETSP1450-20131203/76933_1 /TAXON_ID=753684 ORGANISM="Madagascaria erythrocladiodes, Strain CCMP3234" /NCGR_SAMPLE_ID=MMETSP1450 /ASSEMBLY_ACC=CAM_ASM_001115 /LENGTH=148 /DNA_ID=CAMNT_0044051343 /DNA_START=24 /DNA_END=467 /DNA_ORIENTATION=-